MKFIKLAELFDKYIETTIGGLESKQRSAAKEWRLSRIYDGKVYADYIEGNFFPLMGKLVIDIGCAWGGNLLAFCPSGANCIGFDINNHMLGQLNVFCQSNALHCRFQLATYKNLPLKSGSCDVVLAFDLIEHINCPQVLASEVHRVLKDGGIAVLTTPPRVKSFFEGEPHFQLKHITFLPLSIQKIVAFKIFKKQYPYPVNVQYSLVSQILRPFLKIGFIGLPVCGGRIAKKMKRIQIIRNIYRQIFWDFFIVIKKAKDNVI
jgi:2-polyprenyl-3-methyl-5-hydroxy-6-metoxy-1,4-benzoquinol methylase